VNRSEPPASARLFPRKPPAAARGLLRQLRRFILPWRALTIGIDGRPGAGKSELGRLLAWQLDVPLIETDLWMFPSLDPVRYRYAQIRTLAARRHKLKRPVIVEGIKLLETLRRIKIECDFLIWVQNSHVDPEDEEDFSLIFEFGGLRAEVERYFADHNPEARANYAFRMV
jgi:hypothetical protein